MICWTFDNIPLKTTPKLRYTQLCVIDKGGMIRKIVDDYLSYHNII